MHCRHREMLLGTIHATGLYSIHQPPCTLDLSMHTASEYPDALQVLRALALRSGVVVYDTAVIGWRQHFSGHMELRHASPTMRRWGESAVAECGQLVLAPEAWAPEQLAWFGLGAAEEAGWAAAAWDGENSFDKDDQSEPVKPMATDLTTQAASQPAVLGTFCVCDTRCGEQLVVMQLPHCAGLQSVAATQLQCGNPSDSARLLASPCAALLDVRNWVDGEGPGRCVMVPLGGGGPPQLACRSSSGWRTAWRAPRAMVGWWVITRVLGRCCGRPISR